MPFGANKDAKVTAEYRAHEKKIMQKAAEKRAKKEEEVYRSIVVDIISQLETDLADVEDYINFPELMEKYEIKRR